MNVLIVSNMFPGRNPNFLYNGIFVKEQYDSLISSGCDVDLFIIDGYKSKLNYIKTLFEIKRKIKLGNYDVVHIHYGLSGLFLLINPFVKKYKNTILTLHGGDILSEQGKFIQVFLTKLIVRKAGKVLTLNDEMNGIVSKIRPDFTVAPCGVDTDLFRSDDVKPKNIVLFPGAKNREVKNYPLFENIIKSYNETNNVVDVVAIDGFSRVEVADLLRTSTCIIMTSNSEGSPQIIKEALSCDLPVLSVDVGDVKKILGSTPGTKIFARTEDVNVVAAYINDVIAEANISKGARRKRIFDLGLSQDAVVNKLLAIYKGI